MLPSSPSDASSRSDKSLFSNDDGSTSLSSSFCDLGTPRIKNFDPSKLLPDDLDESNLWPTITDEHDSLQKFSSLTIDEHRPKSRSTVIGQRPDPEWKSVIRSVLQEHPLGLTKSVLKYFTALKLGRSLKDSCPYETMEDMLEDNPGFLEVGECPGMESIYFLQNPNYHRIDMKKLLSRLRHRLQIILINQKGIMPANKFLDQLKAEFGVDLAATDWGFGTVESLIEFLLSMFPSSTIRCIPVITAQDKESTTEIVLHYEDGSCPEIIGKIVDAEDEQTAVLQKERKSTDYDGWFVRFGDELDYYGYFIEEWNLHECIVTRIHSPFDIFLSLWENWNELEMFQLHLNRYYKPEDQGGILETIPPLLQPHHLIPGMYAAAFLDNEWFRCIIKEYHASKKSCSVLTIDYGIFREIPLNDLRRLHTEVFKKMKGNAINCRLHVKPSHSKYIDAVMDADAGKKCELRDILADIVMEKPLCVTFRKHVFDPVTDDYLWEVDMRLVEGRAEGYLNIDERGDVATMFLNKLLTKFPLKDYVK